MNGGRVRPRLAFVFVAVALAALALAPDLKAFRYASKYKAYAASVFCRDGDLDVLFLGSSRMARAVNAPEIADAYTDLTGEPISIADMARPGLSAFVWNRLLADQLERRDVGLVIAELSRSMKPPTARNLGKLGNVLPNEDYVRTALRNERAGFPLNLLLAAEARLGSLEAGLGNLWMGCGAARASALHDTTVARRTKASDALRPGRIGPARTNRVDREIDTEAFAYMAEIARDLVAQAHRHDTRIVFVNLNSLLEKPVGAQARKTFRNRVGAELKPLPPKLNQALRADMMYADTQHLDETGAALLAPWLAAIIDEQLSAAPQGQGSGQGRGQAQEQGQG
ncbi:hypothetical protein [Microbaculum sp. FT89]|uniref:hypothetical protein n=1 Tax=Microbaculum sp. FT89 TaxID=3447298 RepID=UPI003F534063